MTELQLREICKYVFEKRCLTVGINTEKIFCMLRMHLINVKRKYINVNIIIENNQSRKSTKVTAHKPLQQKRTFKQENHMKNKITWRKYRVQKQFLTLNRTKLYDRTGVNI